MTPHLRIINDGTSVPTEAPVKPHRRLRYGRLRGADQYDPELMISLKGNHRDLEEMVQGLFRCLDARQYAGMPERLTAMKTRLESHLLAEDYRLYWYIETQPCGDAMDNRRDEMTDVAKGIVRFLDIWQQRTVSPENADQFRRRLEDVRCRLRQRIEHQEQNLFPLYLPPEDTGVRHAHEPPELGTDV